MLSTKSRITGFSFIDGPHVPVASYARRRDVRNVLVNFPVADFREYWTELRESHAFVSVKKRIEEHRFVESLIPFPKSFAGPS